MSFSIDPFVSSRQNLLNMVKAYNPALTAGVSQVGFFTPQVLTGGTKNTVTRLGGIIGLGVKGFKNIIYNRKTPAAVITTPLAPVNVAGVIAISKHAFLSEINTQTGLKLRTDEVVDGPILIGEFNLNPIVLTMTGNSEIWLPGSTITINLIYDEPVFPSGTFIDIGDGDVLGLGEGEVLDVT